MCTYVCAHTNRVGCRFGGAVGSADIQWCVIITCCFGHPIVCASPCTYIVHPHTEGAHTEGAHTEGAHTEGAHTGGAHTERTDGIGHF